MEYRNYRTVDVDTNVEKYQFPSELPKRPSYNSNGKQIEVRINQFKVNKYPNQDVWQYDVSPSFQVKPIHPLTASLSQILIGNGAEKRGLIDKVWKSRTVQQRITAFSPYWLWDGNKIAW
jgi:eukaryotic translation initiation factor 2C